MAKTIASSLAEAFDWRKRPDLRLSLAMLVILLSGAALRLYGLDRTSLWIDEATSWFEARQPFWSMIQATANDDSFPLYHIILYTAIRLFGDSEIALRLPSAIMGIVNIYLLYRLGTVLWDRLTGVFAASFLTLSGFHLWYSQEARFYSLLTLASTAFALATVHFLSRPNWLRAALCMASGIALLYTHVYGISVWVAINIAAAAALLTGANWVSADGKRWLAINGLAGLGFLAWVPSFVGQAHRTISDFWVPFPTPRFLYFMSVSIAGGAAMLGCMMVLILLSVLPASAGGERMEDRVARPATRPAVALSLLAFEFGWQKVILLSWGLVPFLIGYAISITSRPILFDRYLIGSLPALMLLAARGLRVLCFNRVILAGALTTLLACSLPMLHADLTTKMREDHRAAVAAFARQFRNSDEVVCFGMYQSFAYYFRAPIVHKLVIGGSPKYYNLVFIDPATDDNVVMHDPATADFDWPDARRVWLFFREPRPREMPKLLKRIEVSYLLEQELHFYQVTEYLYVRKPRPGTAVVAIRMRPTSPLVFLRNEDWTHGPYYGSQGTFLADVNGDGNADAIVVNDDTVTVRRSDGSSFLPAEDWTQGAYYGSRGTFFADINGDGKADAIVVNDDTVTVRRSDGSSFLPAEDWTQGAYYGTRGTFFADVNGDGKADAIVVNDDTVTVRPSDGSSFLPNENWTHGAYYGSRGTFFADVNGDGKADAIVVNNDTVTVRLSDGSSFLPNENWTRGAYYGSRGTFLADVNGDGDADAIVVNDDSVTIRLSDGSSFLPNENWTRGAYYGSRGTFFADVNGDGKADAIVVSKDTVTVRRSGM